MLHFQSQIADVFGAFDDPAVGVSAHVNADDSDAAAVARCAVGDEQRLGAVKLPSILYLSPQMEHQVEGLILVLGLLDRVAEQGHIVIQHDPGVAHQVAGFERVFAAHRRP